MPSTFACLLSARTDVVAIGRLFDACAASVVAARRLPLGTTDLLCFERAVRPNRFAVVFDLVLVMKVSLGCERRLRPTTAAPQTTKAGGAGASTSLTARHDTDSNARFRPQSQSFLSNVVAW
jgi:hypothetical protein